MMQFLKAFCFVVAAVGLTVSVAQAQTNPRLDDFDNGSKKQKSPLQVAQKIDKLESTAAKPNQDKVVDKKPTPPPVTKRRRAELMDFVKSHHPEIRPLLNSLQKKRPAYYQSALRALDREIKNLQALKLRSPERYEKSLALWVAKSKIKLLSAQLAIKKTQQEKLAIRKKLRHLIRQQHDFRVGQLADDVAQTKQRLEKLEATLATLDANRENEIQKQMDVIVKNSQRISSQQKKAADKRAAEKRAADKKAAEAKKQAEKTTPQPPAKTPPVDKKKNPRSEDDSPKK